MDVSTQTLPTVIYARVSTSDQKCEMQLTELREYAQRCGLTITQEYVDRGFSGAKSDRPALGRLMADASMKRFAVLLVWKLDRFGRSVRQLVDHIQTLDRLGIRFVVPTQAIDTDQRSPVGRLLLNVLAALAEFERDLIRERVTAGLSEYRRAYVGGRVGHDRHSRSGRDLAVGRPRKIFRRDQVAQMRKAGQSWRAIAAALGVPVSTVRRSIQSG